MVQCNICGKQLAFWEGWTVNNPIDGKVERYCKNCHDSMVSDGKSEKENKMQKIQSFLDKMIHKEPNVKVEDIKELIKENKIELAEEKLNELIDIYDEFEQLKKRIDGVKLKANKLTGRLANGEIDKESYNKARSDLEGQKKEIEEKLWKLRNKLFKDDYEKPF